MPHQPVLLPATLAALSICPTGTYVDATFGSGGHAQAILKELQGGRLVAFDQDQAAAQVAAQVMHPAFTFVHANARFMPQFLAYHGVQKVDGILADLGTSAHQLDTAARGFAARHAGPLDMRMDVRGELTAQGILATYTARQLQLLLQDYGEVHNARTVAQGIVAARASGPLQTTADLRALLQRWAPRGREYKYCAKVFQALRIEVNDELGALKDILQQSVSLLKPGGRLVVLAYHSLEDRPVKRFLKTGNFEGKLNKNVYGHVLRPLQPLHSKPTRPTAAELSANNRARSAKLRVGVRSACTRQA